MKDLIQKYWKGETSLAEEQQLREWLASSPSTTENRHLAQLLNWYDQEAQRAIPTPVEEPKAQKTARVRSLSWKNWVVGIAAAIVLLFALSKIWEVPVPESSAKNLAYTDTYEDPEEALEAAKNALMMMSKKMNSTKKHKKKLKKIEILSDLVESYKKN